MNHHNNCVYHRDYWHKEADGFYCIASDIDFKTHNLITMILKRDLDLTSLYKKCDYCEMEDSPHSRCKFLVLEQRQIGPHMYKCANDEAVKEAELSQKLEDL